MELFLLIISITWVATFLANFIVRNPEFKGHEFLNIIKEGYINSPLRVFWKGIYFIVVYILGLTFLIWWKSAELPAMYIKKFLKFLFFTEKK